MFNFMFVCRLNSNDTSAELSCVTSDKLNKQKFFDTNNELNLEIDDLE